MWSKISPRRILLVVVFVGFCFSLGSVFHAVSNGGSQSDLSSFTANIITAEVITADTANVITTDTENVITANIITAEVITADTAKVITANVIVPYEQDKVNSGFPIRLTIPKIKVDATIGQVGLAADGAMDAPKDPASVAWFNLGPRPGENGSAVIAGHYGWKNGIPAAFDNLRKLVKGDKLCVEDGKGATTTFVVREVRTYDQNEDASDVFTSSDGKAHLNLITCGGVYDKIKKSYSNRLVVFTDKEVK